MRYILISVALACTQWARHRLVDVEDVLIDGPSPEAQALFRQLVLTTIIIALLMLPLVGCTYVGTTRRPPGRGVQGAIVRSR